VNKSFCVVSHIFLGKRNKGLISENICIEDSTFMCILKTVYPLFE